MPSQTTAPRQQPAQQLLGLLCLTALAGMAVGRPTLVPLERQEVPVKRNGQVVARKAAYSGRIRLGWPNTQEFSVVFDTGSGHLAVPSTGCTGPACQVRKQYSVERSNTAALVNADGRPITTTRDVIDITYGTGSVTGDLVRETVCLAAKDAAQNGACVELSIVAATEMSEEPFTAFTFDGIFGLGLESLSVAPAFNFLRMLEDQGLAEVPEFGIFLRREAGASGFDGELAFGGRNPARIAGPLAWAPVVAKETGHWQVEVLGLRIGNESLAICEQGCRAIVDTGTSHLGVPKAHARNVYDMLTVAPGESEACHDLPAPDVHIELAGFTLTVRGQDYLHPKPSPPKAGSEPAATTCRPRIMPVTMPPEYGSVFIFGEPLLLRYYTVFDWREPKVGFALASEQEEHAGSEMEADPTVIVLLQVRAVFDRRPVRDGELLA